VGGAGGTGDPGDPRALCRALAHEVGNALTAVRLAAHALGREGATSGRRGAAADAAAAAARAGVALAELRALLSDAPSSAAAPASVAAALRNALPGDLAARLEASLVEGVRAARAEPEALAHLLAGIALALDDAAGPAQRLGLRVASADAGVTFALEAGTTCRMALAQDSEGEPTGPALQLRVAAALVARWGGALAVSESEGGVRIELSLPPA
jgi:hypothetical protein